MLLEVGESQLVDAFKKYNNKSEDSFLTSLPYHLLTGRKGLRVFNDADAHLIVACHPNKENTLLVFPEINGNGSLTIQVLNQLSQEGLNIQLARYQEHDFKKLCEAMKWVKSSTVLSITRMEETILDWKYSSRIVDVEQTACLSGKKYAGLRRAFNTVSKKEGMQELSLSHPDALHAIEGNIMIWAGLMTFKDKKTHEMTGFYTALLKAMNVAPELFDGFVLIYQNEPIGFTIWDNCQTKTVSALANLSKRSIPYLSEYQLIRACQILNEKGVDQLDLGGSESQDLDAFKLKLKPSSSVSLQSYQVNYNNFPSLGIKETVLVPSGHVRLK